MERGNVTPCDVVGRFLSGFLFTEYFWLCDAYTVRLSEGPDENEPGTGFDCPQKKTDDDSIIVNASD